MRANFATIPVVVVTALYLSVATAAQADTSPPVLSTQTAPSAPGAPNLPPSTNPPNTNPPSAPSTSTSTPLPTSIPGVSAAPDLAAAIARARQAPVYLTADLDGRDEVSAAGEPAVGDPDGSGNGQIRVQGDRVTFTFGWQNIGAPTFGGVVVANGDVKVPLFTSALPANTTATSGAVTVTDPTMADQLRTDSSGFYLNLRSAEYPGGAVRGRLRPLGRPADMLGLLNGGGERALLSGDQEVPVAGGPAVGDADGRAVSFIRPSGDRVDYSFAWLGVSPTLGHIHRGAFGANGPVVVPLFTTPIPSTVFAVSGTVTGLDPALVDQIRTNPAGFFANLHSAEFPEGATRGQLS